VYLATSHDGGAQQGIDLDRWLSFVWQVVAKQLGKRY